MDGDVTACIQRNVPEPDSIRAIRLTSRDRQGSETVTVVKMYGRRNDSGMRQLLIQFREPVDVRGTSLLILEREDENEIYFASPEFPKPKRIAGSNKASRLFGSDFSYEDFEYLEGFRQAGDWKRLEDRKLGDRDCYVAEIRPMTSGYERILSYVDQKTCVPLKMKFYEAGGSLRKELTTNPQYIQQKGSVWIAHMALMEDLRDFTTTQLLVDSTVQDVLLPTDMFSVEGMQVGQR